MGCGRPLDRRGEDVERTQHSANLPTVQTGIWSHARPLVRASWALLMACGLLHGQTTELISVGQASLSGNGASTSPRCSADGRFVVFESEATDLMPTDTNGFYDVFLRDRVTGITERVSVSTAGVEPNFHCLDASVSGDGRYVVFASSATNLVQSPIVGSKKVYVRDRVTSTTQLVNVSSSGQEVGLSSATDPEIADDGQHVVFTCGWALDPIDTNGLEDIYIRDIQLGATELVSLTSTGGLGLQGHASDPSVSADGLFVAFQSSATNLVPGDTNGKIDVFVRDRVQGTTTRTSVSSSGAEANGDCFEAAISASGTVVAFRSLADNLVVGDTNGVSDVFVRDLAAGTTTRVSVSSDGVQGNGLSYQPSLSADGRWVAFSSVATNLTSGDINGVTDIFVHDRQSGQTKLVSVNSNGVQGNLYSYAPATSSDGRFMVFASNATNLFTGDGNLGIDVFIRDTFDPWSDLGGALAGASGAPHLLGTGNLTPWSLVTFAIGGAAPFSQYRMVIGITIINQTFKGGVMVPNPDLIVGPFGTDFFGGNTLAGLWPVGIPPGVSLYIQAWISDATGPLGFTATNALQATTP